MFQSNAKLFSINPSILSATSKHGCLSIHNISTQKLAIQNHPRCNRTSARLHNNDQIILGAKNYVSSCYNNDKPPYIKLKRTGKRLSLPFILEQGSTDDGHPISSRFRGFSKFLMTLYRFSRPHTIFGTLIGVTSVSILPLHSVADISPHFIMGLIKALVPAVLMNIYVVGLNQMYDVQIDKVNKPDLPLASGELTVLLGSIIVTACGLLSFVLGFAFQSPPLMMALVTSFFLGSAYSIDLPLLRWKRQPFLAAASIVIVRAMVVQLAFFVHVQKYVLGRPVILTKSVMFATAFMCFFATVIALFKDIPDVDGDKYFGIQSFTIKLGKEKIFWLCIFMLLAAYGAASALGLTSATLLTKSITVGGHILLALLLWVKAQSVDLADKASITSFYMFIWKLFYAEYFLIPFIG